MTETGIYGGSFNPIHRGHVELAERLCRDEGLDELWFMVSPQNPFKKSSPDLLNENIRLELARMAVREHPCLKVSDFEFRLPRPSYTADTLAALRQAYPDRLFTLVIGADNWLAFKDWKKPDEILSHHRILVYPRPGYAVEAASLPPGVKLTDTPLIDISSTELRRLISAVQQPLFRHVLHFCQKSIVHPDFHNPYLTDAAYPGCFYPQLGTSCICPHQTACTKFYPTKISGDDHCYVSYPFAHQHLHYRGS